MAAANGTTRAGSVGSASPAGAMLRLLRLTLLPPVSCRELPKSRRSGGAILISPVLFIVMQGAAMPRAGNWGRFHIFYSDLLRQLVTGCCNGSGWPRPPDESIRLAAFLSVVAQLGDDVCAEPFETYCLQCAIGDDVLYRSVELRGQNCILLAQTDTHAGTE